MEMHKTVCVHLSRHCAAGLHESFGKKASIFMHHLQDISEQPADYAEGIWHCCSFRIDILILSQNRIKPEHQSRPQHHDKHI